MTASAYDYLWFAPLFPELATAYCLTLVRDVAPDTLLLLMGAEDRPAEITGVKSVLAAARAGDAGRSLVCATPASAQASAQWTLAIEPAGAIGVTPVRMRVAATETRLVSHYRDAAARDQFLWMDNGEVRLQFAPLNPGPRQGKNTDAQDDLLRAVGMLPRAGEEEYVLHREAAFALAEELTGVRLTPDLLDDATYECAPAPAAPPPAYQPV